MEDLYNRLPRLIMERAAWSAAEMIDKGTPRTAQSLASSSSQSSQQTGSDFPTTLRLTARVVVQEPSRRRKGRRPFETHSKQAAFDGKTFMKKSDEKSQADWLRRSVMPLLQELVLASSEIDLTRINIAVANFRSPTARVHSRASSLSASPFAWKTVRESPAAQKPQKGSHEGMLKRSSHTSSSSSFASRKPAKVKKQRIDQYFSVIKKSKK